MNAPGRLSPRRFSPYKKICEVPVRQVQQALITVFKTWGVPKWIKVDNGRPFGDPQLEIIPPLGLWLISLGIQVIWNRPRTPQDNAKVERSQGVLGNWTEFSKCKDAFDLQIRLWEEADFHNYHFPIRRMENQKRIEAFPGLAFTGRNWNPADFSIQRALDFLSTGSWERKTSTNGQFSHYGTRFNVGRAFKNQRLSIKLCPIDNVWHVYDPQGNLIKGFHTNFSSVTIWNLDFS